MRNHAAGVTRQTDLRSFDVNGKKVSEDVYRDSDPCPVGSGIFFAGIRIQFQHPDPGSGSKG